MPANQTNDQSFRYINAFVTPFTINFLHLRNPWVTAWWSAAFPGFGHLMLCKYFIAYALMLWELTVNYLSHINLAIYYSMIGQFHAAAQTLDTQWLLFYITPYVFCIWDTYRRTVELNKLYMNGYWYGDIVLSRNISALELNYLDKRSPRAALIWSLFGPGLGHFYLNRLPSVFFILIYTLSVVHFSHLPTAIHLVMIGNWRGGTAVLNPQWLLYLPSIYTFAAYDAYVNAVEYNRLFENEQAKYFRTTYQDPGFPLVEELPCIR